MLKRLNTLLGRAQMSIVAPDMLDKKAAPVVPAGPEAPEKPSDGAKPGDGKKPDGDGSAPPGGGPR